MSRTRQVLVLADDITGANDTAVQFARSGWRAYLALTQAGMGVLDEEQVVVARSLGTRAESAEAAAARTELAVVERGAGRHVYLKIDSTMRGSVAGQLAGAVRGKRTYEPESFAVLCPAYPAMGRTVRNGEILVDGEPAHRGPAGRDPITPINTSTLSELVPDGVRVPLMPDPADLAVAINRAALHATCVVVDAESEADLDCLAQAIGHLGERVVPAGSAGLAMALAARWGASLPSRTATDEDTPEPAARHTAVVVSSQHQAALDQVRATLTDLPASAIGSSVAAWEDVASEEGTRRWAEDVLAHDGRPIHLLQAPPLNRDRGGSGSDGPRVAKALADVVSRLADARPNDLALVLVGGDGAAAVLSRLGAEALRVTGALVEGVPVGTVVGGRHAGLRIATKAGGFGDNTTLTRIVSKLNPTLVGADQ
ncbi:hypothetical protein OO014_11810 [Intrasporangium calvum]|uniref:Type III effector Hrp-dependent outer protein n=1 Tax=Intrasporangium calvum TaxID=53358 RepID=A0ABT5GI63_9MICO|nr:four-carbon acid sugar kinase family protein [Intrasporangium calvum]MDC5697947.1 hypothetical protein [Intrasporangium calvum]